MITAEDFDALQSTPWPLPKPLPEPPAMDADTYWQEATAEAQSATNDAGPAVDAAGTYQHD